MALEMSRGIRLLRLLIGSVQFFLFQSEVSADHNGTSSRQVSEMKKQTELTNRFLSVSFKFTSLVNE